MPQKSHKPTTSAYGGNESRGGQRGSGFSFDDDRMYGRRAGGSTQQRGRQQQQREPERENALGVYSAFLFDPSITLGTNRGGFVRGMPIPENDEGQRVLSFSYTLPPEVTGGKPEIVKEDLDVTAWLAKRNRAVVWDNIKLVSIEVPAVNPRIGEPGIVLFCQLPGSGGFRVQTEERMTSEEYRTEVCYIELRYRDERERQGAKKALPKEFRIAGPDGSFLRDKGVRVVYPIFGSGDERKRKKPHEHILLLERGSRVEVIFEYRHESSVPNWFEIGVRADGTPYCINIRDQAGQYMQAAQARLESEKQAEVARIEEMRSAI